MKIVIIGRPMHNGILSANAVRFMQEKGSVCPELLDEYPCVDAMDRTDPFLVEAVEKFGEEMPHLEIIDLPSGTHQILGVHYDFEELTGYEIVVTKGFCWMPKVHSLGEVASIEVS